MYQSIPLPLPFTTYIYVYRLPFARLLFTIYIIFIGFTLPDIITNGLLYFWKHWNLGGD